MFYEKSKKRNRHGKYHKINEILFEWYKRCCVCNIYSNNVMLKVEAMTIKENFKKVTLIISTPRMAWQITGKQRIL